MQCPLICCTQKIVLYETQARYYVVGSNNTETRFRVLKIDRTEPCDLHVTDDKVDYSRKEIRDLLLTIDGGNRPRSKLPPTRGIAPAGLTRTVSAFGIVGFVRFLEGYYIILITKRRRVALIGQHTIYKVEDTSMVYLPKDVIRYNHPDEQKYVKMFQSVDLSSNFYFSYSYDLTRTFQYNMAPCQGLNQDQNSEPAKAKHKVWGSDVKMSQRVYDTPHTEENVEDASQTVNNFLDPTSRNSSEERDGGGAECGEREGSGETVLGVQTEPAWKFAWNLHMLRQVKDVLHSDWLLCVIHGFVGQSNVVVYGKPIYLTLVGRRSNQFAGTRFLKRGANEDGAVANEVETEQIVLDASVSALSRGRFTSYVQLRGSIPLHWSQDISKMVPKPPISLDMCDPYGFIAGQHFNHVLRRYGSPCIILNLVKQREKKPHESILSEELVNVIRYLNQFLSDQHALQYIGFDMARVSKSKNKNVLHRLEEIAEYCVKKTGFFQSSPDLHCNKLRRHPRCRGLQSPATPKGRRQHGVVRTNCVDCLDRTNTAQFAISKCALAFQLHALGVIDCPYVDLDTDCVRMLEDLYEDHGDTLAVQYGGSQLVHRIKGYRKIAPWTTSSRDIMHTLARYYSNTFSDAEKQHAINVFLGVFEPQDGQPNVWDLVTDYYLHNPVTLWGPQPHTHSYTQWWDDPVTKYLPLPYEEETKTAVVVVSAQPDDERVSGYWDYYRPYELTTLDDLYCFTMPNSIRDFMPKVAYSCSPFVVRGRLGRHHEDADSRSAEVNPNLRGNDSTASSTSTGSEGSTSSSEGSDLDGDIDILDPHQLPKEESGLSLVSLKDLFPTMAQTYGVEIREPPKPSTTLYKRYVQLGENATCKLENQQSPKMSTSFISRSVFPLDSSYYVEPPTVSQPARDIYQTYVTRGQQGAGPAYHRDMTAYTEYLRTKYL